MKATLNQRLAAIEAATASADDFMVCRVIFVAPGQPSEVHSCYFVGHPERFVRTPDETEDSFMARVEEFARARREPGQSVAVALCSADGTSSEGE